MSRCRGVFQALLIVLLGLAALTISASSAHAQASAASQARDHIRAGLAYAERGKWEDALREFEEAYTLEPTPAHLFDVAQARAKTGRFRAAAAAFGKLTEATTSLSAEQQARARAGLAAAKEKIARIKVTTTSEQGATTVTIDQQEATLERPNEVDPGKHVVRLMRQGKILDEQTIEVGEGTEVAVALAAPPPSEPAPLTKSNALGNDPSERRSPKPSRGSAYLLGGIAIASLGVGGYLSIAGKLGYDELEESGCVRDKICKSDEVQAVQTNLTVGNVLLGVGVIAAAFATWLFLKQPAPPARP